MITSPVLLDRHIALWTFFCVGSDPVGRFGIIITFLDPFAQETTLHGIVPLLAALKAEDVPTFAFDRAGFDVLDLHGIAAVS